MYDIYIKVESLNTKNIPEWCTCCYILIFPRAFQYYNSEVNSEACCIFYKYTIQLRQEKAYRMNVSHSYVHNVWICLFQICQPNNFVAKIKEIKIPIFVSSPLYNCFRLSSWLCMYLCKPYKDTKQNYVI